MDFKTEYFNIWTTAWNFHKRYHGVAENEEQHWQQLIAEAEQICKRYENRPEEKFMESLMLAVIGQLNRSAKWKEKQNKE